MPHATEPQRWTNAEPHPWIDRILFSEDQLRARARELALQISSEYVNRNPLFLCVLTGSIHFFSDLTRNILIPASLDACVVSSYESVEGEAVMASGPLSMQLNGMKHDVQGREVIIVEDIVDTARTLCCLKNALLKLGAASVAVCTMLDKPAGRKVKNVIPDWVGFTIPSHFVVGYGLDFDYTLRQLPYVGILKPEAYKNTNKS